MRLHGPILIVGAGIGGLTAALCLAQAGFEVEIIERAERLRPVGAGIQLSANALRVLHRLNVGRSVEAAGVVARSVTLRAATSGRVIVSVPVTSTDGTGYVAIHRGDLQHVLLDAVSAAQIPLKLGHEVVGLEPEDDGATLVLRSGGAETLRRRAPLVVAADGVGSACAAALKWPAATPAGTTALRWIAPAAASGAPMTGIEAWLGGRRHAVAYPIRGGAELNLVLIAPARDAGGEDHAGIDAVRSWDPRLRRMIDAARPAGRWSLATTPASRPMTAGGSVALLGDAAHALLPYAAQGAAMAIEDAHVLARSLKAATELPQALAGYEAERRPRIERVRRRVRFHDVVYHLPRPLSFGRDLALALRSQEALRRDLAWLYDWQPE